MVEAEKFETVKFNQAAYDMMRLNDIMRVINYCWSNPLIKNIEFFDYNYNVLFKNLNNYYFTICSKLTDKERKDLDNIRNSIKEFLRKHPVYKFQQKKIFPYNVSEVLDLNSWSCVEEQLINYQKSMLQYADKHGLGNPTKKDPRAAVTN